jgi:hypothetical protein
MSVEFSTAGLSVTKYSSLTTTSDFCCCDIYLRDSLLLIPANSFPHKMHNRPKLQLHLFQLILFILSNRYNLGLYFLILLVKTSLNSPLQSGFQVLTRVTVKSNVFWNMTPCIQVEF